MRQPRHNGVLRFVQAFLANPMAVGAVLPSSRELARAMVRGLTLEDGEQVIELGPGTGAVTAQIRHLLPRPEAYLGIEREPRFVEILEQRFPELRFIVGSAEEAREICDAHDVRRVKLILSGLPFGNQRTHEQDRILDQVEHLLEAGGRFRTFQYLHAYALPPAVRFRREMRRRIGRPHRSPPLMANLPPAYVLTWSR